MNRSSLREIVHLVTSLVVLTIAFSYPDTAAEALAIAAVGVGSGFLLHELAHKFVAQRYGFFADYEASPLGLMLAVGLSIFTNGGFVFAAPGAVMIRGKRFASELQDEKEFAYISVAGAVVNLVLAVLFITGSVILAGTLLKIVLSGAAAINVFLAGFNMIPFGPLDGAKVWRYNKVLWAIVMIPSIILFLSGV